MDLDGVVERIDVDAVLARVDLDAVLERVDLDAVLARVDIDALLDRITPDQLLDRVTPDRLLDRVDPNRLLDRVDPDRLLDRLDPDRLLDRVDANRLLDRVDVNRLVERTELQSIIARSTSGVFTQVLDVVRTKLISVDQVVQGAASYVVRRTRSLPARPEDRQDIPDVVGRPPAERAVKLQGHFAGSVSRFLAFITDQFVLGLLYALGFALMSSAAEVVLGRPLDVLDHRLFVSISYLVWAFLYLAIPLAVSGRTFGKAVLGLQVVRADGHDLSFGRAALRTLVFPLSFLLFGAGFLLGLVRRDRRELHDLVGGTAVVYAWDARTAELRAPVA